MFADLVVPRSALAWGYLDGWRPPAPKGMAWYWRPVMRPTTEVERRVRPGLLLTPERDRWILGAFPPAAPSATVVNAQVLGHWQPK